MDENNPNKSELTSIYSCGELLINIDEWRISFKCDSCDQIFQNLEDFRTHYLSTHLGVEQLEVQNGSEEDILNHSLTEHYLEEYIEEEDDHTIDDVESLPAKVVESVADDDHIETVDEEDPITDLEKALEGSCDERSEFDFENYSNDLQTNESTTYEESNVKSSENYEELQEFEDIRKIRRANVDKIDIGGRGPFTCEECGKLYLHRNTFKQHVQMHRGIKPYECDICGVPFRDIGNLKCHRRRHLGIKKYECTICDKKFISSTELKIHERSHTGERPYKCNICENAFTTSSGLNSHRRVQHTKERRHTCNLCDKSFFEKKILKDHLVKHTGEKPHECSSCNAKYSTRKSLRQHMAKCHYE